MKQPLLSLKALASELKHWVWEDGDLCSFCPNYQRDPDFRKLMAEIALRRQRIACQHCSKDLTPGMFARWHGDKCKYKEYP